MNPQLIRIANRIAQKHPNLIRPLFRGIKDHLPFGIGEGKVKDVVVENIPEWFWDSNLHDLREFLDEVMQDPKAEEWWAFNKEVLRKVLYDK